jgi:hypothetical protein
MKRILLVILLISLIFSGAESMIPDFRGNTKMEEGPLSRLFGGGRNSQRAAGKSKKKQEAKTRKQKKDWDKYVKKSQQHTYEIQSSDVKARMKQNKRDIDSRDKTKKKHVRKSSKKAGQKYN